MLPLWFSTLVNSGFPRVNAYCHPSETKLDCIKWERPFRIPGPLPTLNTGMFPLWFFTRVNAYCHPSGALLDCNKWERPFHIPVSLINEIIYYLFPTFLIEVLHHILRPLEKDEAATADLGKGNQVVFLKI